MSYRCLGEATMDRIVLQKVSQCFGIGQIVDPDHFQIFDAAPVATIPLW